MNRVSYMSGIFHVSIEPDKTSSTSSNPYVTGAKRGFGALDK
jgi:hypothetical protein